MNQLKLSQQQSNLTLHKAGWSNRAIALELDLNRETVGKYLRSETAVTPAPTLASECSTKELWVLILAQFDPVPIRLRSLWCEIAVKQKSQNALIPRKLAG